MIVHRYSRWCWIIIVSSLIFACIHTPCVAADACCSSAKKVQKELDTLIAALSSYLASESNLLDAYKDYAEIYMVDYDYSFWRIAAIKEQLRKSWQEYEHTIDVLNTILKRQGIQDKQFPLNIRYKNMVSSALEDEDSTPDEEDPLSEVYKEEI
jgi:hypothetical protein